MAENLAVLWVAIKAAGWETRTVAELERLMVDNSAEHLVGMLDSTPAAETAVYWADNLVELSALLRAVWKAV